MTTRGIVIMCVLFFLLSTIHILANGQSYESIVDSITAKLQDTVTQGYSVSGIDVDRCLTNPGECLGKIMDPYHTLSSYFLFLAEGPDDQGLNKPKGLIGLYSAGKGAIVWRSEFLTRYFSNGPMSMIEETDELNRDGKVEIVIGQAGGATGAVEIIWVFNWDGASGKLVTQLDQYGNPTIVTAGDSFRIVDTDGDGIFEITGADPDNLDRKIIYAWDGFRYGNWGKSSKFLVKVKQK